MIPKLEIYLNIIVSLKNIQIRLKQKTTATRRRWIVIWLVTLKTILYQKRHGQTIYLATTPFGIFGINRTEFRLVSNQSEKCNYIPNLVQSSSAATEPEPQDLESTTRNDKIDMQRPPLV